MVAICDWRNFGEIRIVVFVLLSSTWTYAAVCPRTVPYFPLCLGWLTMFTLLLMGKLVGVLVGSLVGESVGVLVGKLGEFVIGLVVEVALVIALFVVVVVMLGIASLVAMN